MCDEQISYCLSQMKRFNKYFMSGDMSRTLQFGYTLGRLQELSGVSDKTIYWNPVEKFYLNNEFDLLDKYIDELRIKLNSTYNTQIISK